MKRILVLYDDIWHPADVIEKGFAALLEKVNAGAGESYAFDYVKTAKDILLPEMLSQYPLIFCCKGNTINAANTEPWWEDGVTEVGPRELRDYIENGGVYVALHAGSDVNPDWVRQEPKFVDPVVEYQDLIGCRFLGHPPRCLVKVTVVDPSHPLMKGVHDFEARDEQYLLDVTEPNIIPLFDSAPAGGGKLGSDAGVAGGEVSRAGFLISRGKGWVIVTTPGHTLSMLTNPDYQQCLENVIRYYL